VYSLLRSMMPLIVLTEAADRNPSGAVFMQ
jgi:hypothetical protein